MKRRVKSISPPIVLGTLSVLMGVALLVGWILIIIQNLSLTREYAQNTWLLVTGIISFATILTVLIMFIVFLVREILEVRRQVTFIDSVTHELKSPLASLKLCLETLNREGVSEEQEAELMHMALEDVDRLNAFIDDVLAASRIGYSQSKVTVVTDVQLEALIRRCAASIARRHNASPEIIEIDVPPDLRLVTDRTALETALKNLLDNAVKYSDEPIKVEVRVRMHDAHRVMIEVNDNGIGVPRKYLRRIFNRFYRAPETDVRARRGTGLGLFVVSALVRSIGGKLEAHSDGPGRGMRMRIVLPLEVEAA